MVVQLITLSIPTWVEVELGCDNEMNKYNCILAVLGSRIKIPFGEQDWVYPINQDSRIFLTGYWIQARLENLQNILKNSSKIRGSRMSKDQILAPKEIKIHAPA